MMEYLEEKILVKKKLYDGKVIDFYLEDVEFLNGKISKWEIVKYLGVVVVFVVIEEGKIILVNQFRKLLEWIIVEILVGKFEKGEEFEYIVLRELEEEMGYMVEILMKIIVFYILFGFVDEIVYFFFVEGFLLLEEKCELDEDEFVEVMQVMFDEVVKLIEECWVYDVKMVYVIQYFQLKEVLKEK